MLTKSDYSMNFFARIMLCCIVVLFAGCASYESFIKHSHERATCKSTCQQRLMACNKTCDNSCPLCCLSANQRAARDYDHYKHQQTIQGVATVRQLKSYRDPLQCRKTTCACPTDYRTCIQTCTGKIPKRLQVAPYC